MCCAFIPRSSSVSPFGPFASWRLGRTGKGGLGSPVGSGKVLGVSPESKGASTCAGGGDHLAKGKQCPQSTRTALVGQT